MVCILLFFSHFGFGCNFFEQILVYVTDVDGWWRSTKCSICCWNAKSAKCEVAVETYLFIYLFSRDHLNFFNSGQTSCITVCLMWSVSLYFHFHLFNLFLWLMDYGRYVSFDFHHHCGSSNFDNLDVLYDQISEDFERQR